MSDGDAALVRHLEVDVDWGLAGRRGVGVRCVDRTGVVPEIAPLVIDGIGCNGNLADGHTAGERKPCQGGTTVVGRRAEQSIRSGDVAEAGIGTGEEAGVADEVLAEGFDSVPGHVRSAAAAEPGIRAAVTGEIVDECRVFVFLFALLVRPFAKMNCRCSEWVRQTERMVSGVLRSERMA